MERGSRFESRIRWAPWSTGPAAGDVAIVDRGPTNTAPGRAPRRPPRRTRGATRPPHEAVHGRGRPQGRRGGAATGSGDVVTAVDDVTLDIRDGEFFSMLGPSGSGKTTTLRMIAGFELPTEGRVWLHGEDVTDRPPFERDVNTVFQDYALFPHMNGRRQRRLRPDRPEGAEAGPRAANRRGARDGPAVGLRAPQARTALRRPAAARRPRAALVNRPRVLLLDEPLGALDLKLREEMQIELKAIQQEVGITFIYVTHDQEEALTMSDRLAVFNRGRIEQIGTPADLYERPATAFVAGFVGTSNLLRGDVAKRPRRHGRAVHRPPGEDPNERAGCERGRRRGRRGWHHP